MTDVIQWARLDNPSPAVSALDWPEPSYMYLERVPDAWLAEAERQNGLRLEAFDPTTLFNEWERGRIFCAAFELRWEMLDGAFQTVYVGAQAELPGFTVAEDLDLSGTEIQEHSYALWGNRIPNDQLETVGVQKQEGLEVFVEFQVPRLLYYPVSAQTQWVRLQVCEYVEPGSGVRHYYRFLELEEMREPL